MIFRLLLLFSLIIHGAVDARGRGFEETDCILGTSHSYSGNRSVTFSGLQCQRWDSNAPHEVKLFPADGGRHNYCRNPEKDFRGTWCYTTDPTTRWQYCQIPKCFINAFAVWNVFDGNANTSHFGRAYADPEYKSSDGFKKAGTVEIGIDYAANAEYKTMDINYRKNLIYYTDIRQNYLGIYNIKTKRTQHFLQGIVRNIESISYDWITENIYWTDSKMKWVMVSDSSLKSYFPVYLARPYTPYAIEVHSVQRRLIFSTYIYQDSETIDAKIISTDLAGKNERVLFRYPDVRKVTSLAIDYKGDCIYWIENSLQGSKVLSGFMNGTGKFLHYSMEQSSFLDVAIFSDYIYTTDDYPRRNMFDEISYRVHVITKNSTQAASHAVTHKPSGLAIYEENVLYNDTAIRRAGECGEYCGGICLPLSNSQQECVCSLGYHLQPVSNNCVANLVANKFLLIVDADEGRAYQISLKSGHDYSKMPFGKRKKKRQALSCQQSGNTGSALPMICRNGGTASRISSVAVDPSSKHVYYSEGRFGTLNKLSMNRGIGTHIADSNARHIEIDGLNGNVFYSDFEGKTITLSLSDGNFQQVIVKPDESTQKTSDIKAFALDLNAKYLYWTDTFSTEGRGKVLRCRFDGRRKQVVLDDLHWPHGIAIDAKTNQLFVLESKTATIYQLPLLSLARIKSTSVDQDHYKRHDLLKAISHRKFLLTEIKVHDGIVYISDEKQSQLQQFDLERGPDSIRGFGPDIFYRASSMAIYDQNYEAEIKSMPDPCKKRSCSSGCIDMNERWGRCLQQQNKRPGMKAPRNGKIHQRGLRKRKMNLGQNGKRKSKKRS